MPLKMIKCLIIVSLINFCFTSRHVHKRNLGFLDYTDPNHEHFKRKPDFDGRTATIKKVKGLYFCDSEKFCESITEFDISQNESFSCFDRNLAIRFQSSDTQNGSKTPVSLLVASSKKTKQL